MRRVVKTIQIPDALHSKLKAYSLSDRRALVVIVEKALEEFLFRRREFGVMGDISTVWGKTAGGDGKKVE